MPFPMSRSTRDKRQAAVDRKERRAAVTNPDIVMEAAAVFLAVRPRSVQETRQRLVLLGYEPGLVESVVDRLVGMGYLDDEEFARAWVESRDRAKPRGEQALRLELARKGIDRQTVDAVLDQRTEATQAGDALRSESDSGLGVNHNANDHPDVAAAERLIARRRSALLRELDPRKRRARAYALLARNGFDPDVCRSVASRVDDQPDAGDE
jgi:regulatory protein